ncbi:MAG: hypothetical protein AAB395_03500 [Patescibacteria group bacterium]
MSSREVIAVDIDDVLAANAVGFVEFSNKKWGTNLVPNDYHDHWAELWGVENHEAVVRADTLVTDRVFRQYNHLEDALPVLKKLTRKYDLIVVTARRVVAKKDTEDWINEYFEGIFKEIHFAGIWDEVNDHSIQKGKGEILRDIGVHYLIDDQVKHCKTAAEHGIQTLLFGNYTWNKVDNLPVNINKVADWKQVEEFFSGQKSKL